MPEIFISYRREDSSGHAGRIFDCMRDRFGEESVFMDVTDIQPGADFTKALDTALSSCRVVLVIIGTQWLTSTDSTGRRRLDDPADRLRLEIVGALRRNSDVIPVLVRGATVPREPDLPDDLRPLAYRQAQEVSDSRWAFDTGQLIRIVENRLGAVDGGDPHAPAGRPKTFARSGGGWKPERSRIWIVAPATLVLLLIGLTGVGMWWANQQRTDSATLPGSNDPGVAAPARGGPAAPSVQFKTAPREKPGARLPASRDVRAGVATFKVLGGLVTGDAGGSQTIRLFVRATNVGAAYGLLVSSDSFRLIVDGQATPPTEAPIVAVAMQSAIENWVVFQVPPNAGAVALQVGDIRQETTKIPIDLRTAGTEISAKPPPTWKYEADLPVTFEKRIGPLLVNVDGARLEHFGDAVPPLQPEKLLLAFKVRIKNVGSQYGHAVTGEIFRLLIDGVPLAPTKFPIQALVFQASLDGDVEFVMPGTATNALLQIGTIGAETARMPIDLSAAH